MGKLDPVERDDGLRSRNYGHYFQCFQQLSKAGFTVPGLRPTSRQHEATLGVPTWPYVWGKSWPCKIVNFYMCRSSRDQASELVACGGETRRQGKLCSPRWFESSFSLTSFSASIHLIQQEFTVQLLCTRHCARCQWNLFSGGGSVYLRAKGWQFLWSSKAVCELA